LKIPKSKGIHFKIQPGSIQKCWFAWKICSVWP